MQWRRSVVTDWVQLIGLTTIATVVTGRLPDWARMWLIAAGLYGGFKWLTWRRAIRDQNASRPPLVLSLAYLLLWPGMNARRFLWGPLPRRPTRGDWLRAAVNVAAGTGILWLLASQRVFSRPSIVGWTGLLGIGLVLHFGSLSLLSLAWQRAGVDAPPIMQRPATACSLADFWGRRWNTAFRDLAFELIYRPLARSWGARPAMAAVFLFSGVVHDLAISLPARAGYGLPTLYFILQAIGVEIERSNVGRRWHLRNGPQGWLFAAALILAPAGLLFHPPFVRQVVLPFLNLFRA
ncbi:MAG TPA: MBOAT family protein [Pirellulales bacterium]|nr:MBOAT family protein [Pirellulales bacterium]